MNSAEKGYAELKNLLNGCPETPYARCESRRLDAYEVEDGYILAAWSDGDAPDLELAEELPADFELI
jgi:hypothetical protein